MAWIRTTRYIQTFVGSDSHGREVEADSDRTILYAGNHRIDWWMTDDDAWHQEQWAMLAQKL